MSGGVKQKPTKMEYELGRVATQLERRNGFWRAFVQGLAVGAGTVIGATIIGALLVTIIVNVLKYLGISLPTV